MFGQTLGILADHIEAPSQRYHGKGAKLLIPQSIFGQWADDSHLVRYSGRQVAHPYEVNRCLSFLLTTAVRQETGEHRVKLPFSLTEGHGQTATNAREVTRRPPDTSRARGS